MIIWCAVIMGGLGILFGVGLAIASRIFHVEIDERVEHVSEALPGVNCGACGYAGCDAYAEAVVGGEQPSLCTPGAHEVALAVAHIMGMKLDDEKQAIRAIVHCQGSPDVCETRYDYDGLPDCRAAHLLQAGPKACDHGCLGFGTCAEACPFGAIAMAENQLPIINWDKCTGCGACAKVCPRNLIETVTTDAPVVLACSNPERGKAVMSVCKVGCISCMICKKVSSEGAVELVNTMPTLTYPEGEDYAAATEKCPKNCFIKVTPPHVGAPVKEAEVSA
jgi:H+/Na+-translocating ferredoxin:NAD+ oxidoreductase subunit B